MLMFISASVAPQLSELTHQYPAVMLAVNCMERATDWMKRLIVLMITSIGINGVGVPCAKKWASRSF